MSCGKRLDVVVCVNENRIRGGILTGEMSVETMLSPKECIMYVIGETRFSGKTRILLLFLLQKKQNL